jgi:hypothetical protein
VKGLVNVWRDSLRDDAELSPTTKLVGFVLSTYSNARGHAFPGRRTLADGSSVSVRSAERAIARLEAAGWVAVSRSRGGRSRTNGYALLLPQTASDVRRLEWETASLRTRNGVTDDVNGVTGDARKQLKAAESPDADAAAPDGASSAPRNEEPVAVWGECMSCGREANLLAEFAYSACSPACDAELHEHEEAQLVAAEAAGYRLPSNVREAS